MIDPIFLFVGPWDFPKGQNLSPFFCGGAFFFAAPGFRWSGSGCAVAGSRKGSAKALCDARVALQHDRPGRFSGSPQRQNIFSELVRCN